MNNYINWNNPPIVYDPYKRDGWYSDGEWEEHIQSLPPKREVENNNDVDVGKSKKKIEPKRIANTTNDTTTKDMITKVMTTTMNIRNTPDKTKSKMCCRTLNGEKCTYQRCNFAHYIEDLTPKRCTFQDGCKYKSSSCCFIHPEETFDNFIIRLGLERFTRSTGKNDKIITRVIGTREEVVVQIRLLSTKGFRHFKVSIN